MPKAVKNRFVKEIPDDLISDEALVNQIKAVGREYKINWDLVTPKILIAAIESNYGMLSCSIPSHLLADDAVAKAMITKQGDYYDRSLQDLYKNPKNRTGWSKETYDLALKRGILTPKDVPDQHKSDKALAASIRKQPEIILDVEKPVEWLNEHEVAWTPGLAPYGFYWNEKGWFKAKPNKAGPDGSYAVHRNGDYTHVFLYDKSSNLVEVIETDRSGKGNLMINSRDRAKLKPLRLTLAEVSKSVDLTGNWQNSLTSLMNALLLFKVNSSTPYVHSHVFVPIEDIEKRTMGDLSYYVHREQWKDSTCFVFTKQSKMPRLRIYYDHRGSSPSFETAKASSSITIGELLPYSPDIAKLMKSLGFMSGANAKFKNSLIYKLGVRCPGRGEWSSLLEEKITQTGSLTVWKGQGRITVTHDEFGVIAVGKKTKDGSFTSTELMPVVPKEISQLLTAFFASLKGKL